MSFVIYLVNQNTGVRAGSFPIRSVNQVTRRKRLDAATRWSFALPAVDPVYPDVRDTDYDFEIVWQYNSQVHALGLASYLTHQLNATGKMAAIEAAGGTYDLNRQTVLQRSFDGAGDDVNDVLTEIVPLRSGWTLGDVDTIATAAPLDFWYETVLEGVDLLAKTFGYHFREGSAAKTLDFGAMGAASGIVAIGGEGLAAGSEAGQNPQVCLIESLNVSYQSDKVVNRLIPFGGAVGVATIDLSEATITQPGYDVESAALPGGGNYYYIEDAASIAAHALTERRFVRSDLRPIVNTAAAREYAANILYEAALATLLNTKDRQTVYELSVVGLEPGAADVGDKLRVRWSGVSETPAGESIWLDLDTDFFILEIDETFGDGVRTTLKINQNAVHEETVRDLLANTIKSFERSTIHVQPTVGPDTYGPYVKRISTTVPATFSFNLGPETLGLYYAKLRLTGEPLKSSIQSVAGASTTTPSGGGSTTPSGGGSATPSGGGGTTPGGSLGSHRHSYPGDPGYTNDTQWAHVHDTPDHTHATPDHTHATPDHDHTFTPEIATTYGIYQDTVRPNTLTITVNGSTVANGITLSAGNSYTYELDITSYILAAANLRQEHTIGVSCGSGQGEIQLQVQSLKIIQPVQVS